MLFLFKKFRNYLRHYMLLDEIEQFELPLKVKGDRIYVDFDRFHESKKVKKILKKLQQKSKEQQLKDPNLCLKPYIKNKKMLLKDY